MCCNVRPAASIDVSIQVWNRILPHDAESYLKCITFPLVKQILFIKEVLRETDIGLCCADNDNARGRCIQIK